MSNNENEKLNLLHKMIKFKNNGMTLSQTYTMDSDINDMKYEVYLLEKQQLDNNLAQYAHQIFGLRKYVDFLATDQNVGKTVS